MNKTIAIVGSAGYLKDKGLGREIDAHDKVLRVNLNFQLIDKYKKDIGKRTDIIYLCVRAYKQYRNKLLKVPEQSEVYIKDKPLRRLHRHQCIPNTGIIAIIDFAVKGYDVYVYGMDFYAGINNGIVPERAILKGKTKVPKVDVSDVYLEGYKDLYGEIEVGHVGGLNDLKILLEYKKQYKNIFFDKHLEEVINKTIKHYELKD